jgi:hypothetical protein
MSETMGKGAVRPLPGTAPREAELVRRWGLENGWQEVAARWKVGEDFPTIQPPESQPRYAGIDVDRRRGFVLFAPDRNDLRPFNQPPTPDEVGRDLRALAFPGESEPLVLGVHALRDLADVAVNLSDLHGPAGAVIHSCPAWDRCGYWTKGYADKTVSLPDITIRDLIYGPLSMWTRVQEMKLFTMWPQWLVPHRPEPLKAGDTRLFWITVRVPAESPPGPYRGTVALSIGGSEQTAVRELTLEVQPFALDGALCSWVPVTATNGFPLAVYQQMAEHHMTGLSWWWDDWGLTVTRDGDRASFDPRPLDLLNAVTREAGMRGPWILLLGSMTSGQLERRIAASGLFDVKMVQRPEAPPGAPPLVGDLDDPEMNRRYVEVLQALATRARERGYPELILIVYDEPTRYLFRWHENRCALIHKHVPELKILATPQGEVEWARNLLPHCDFIDVRGYGDPIYEAVRDSGKGMLGFERLTADLDFAMARWGMGLRFAEQEPRVIYFWGFNYGGLDPRAPFNDLLTPQNWGFRHRFAWPPAEGATLEPSWGVGHRWIETAVWEGQREGAKDYLLLLMLERELAFTTSPDAPAVRRDLATFKRDAAARAPGATLDDRRAQLVAWYRRLIGR